MNINYYFVNETTGEQNEKSIFPNNNHIKWVAKLYSYSAEDIIGFFEKVAEINGWSKTDKIVAYPDDSGMSSIVYENGILFFLMNRLLILVNTQICCQQMNVRIITIYTTQRSEPGT